MTYKLKNFIIIKVRQTEDCDDYLLDQKLVQGKYVTLVAHAHLPTKYGLFEIYGFEDRKTGKEHTAIVAGDVKEAEACPVRIHSQCHTGDVLGSLRCDCHEQLNRALAFIGKEGRGAVIYLKQEGRGIGLVNKIRAYHLQDLGLDTVEANVCLGFPADARDFTAAVEIINMLGIKSVALMTNNPEKIDELNKLGVPVTERIPLVVPPNDHNRRYLETKRAKFGHLP